MASGFDFAVVTGAVAAVVVVVVVAVAVVVVVADAVVVAVAVVAATKRRSNKKNIWGENSCRTKTWTRKVGVDFFLEVEQA